MSSIARKLHPDGAHHLFANCTLCMYGQGEKKVCCISSMNGCPRSGEIIGASQAWSDLAAISTTTARNLARDPRAPTRWERMPIMRLRAHAYIEGRAMVRCG